MSQFRKPRDGLFSSQSTEWGFSLAGPPCKPNSLGPIIKEVLFLFLSVLGLVSWTLKPWDTGEILKGRTAGNRNWRKELEDSGWLEKEENSVLLDCTWLQQLCAFSSSLFPAYIKQYFLMSERIEHDVIKTCSSWEVFAQNPCDNSVVIILILCDFIHGSKIQRKHPFPCEFKPTFKKKGREWWRVLKRTNLHVRKKACQLF